MRVRSSLLSLGIQAGDYTDGGKGFPLLVVLILLTQPVP